MFADVIQILLILAVIIYAYFKWSFSYFQRKNVPYIQPNIPFGNIENPATRQVNIGVKLQSLYNEFKTLGHRIGGVYMLAKPTYILVSPDVIRSVMSQDFQHFTDRGFYHNEKWEPLSGHLFFIGGSKWRNLRAKLTPTFSSGKMKMMFPIMVDCSAQFIKTMESYCEAQSAVDIKEILGCFTTDVIGCCAFGLECNSFSEEDAPFRKYGRKVMPSTRRQLIKAVFSFVFPSLATKVRLKLIDEDVSEFFIKMVKDTVDYREQTKFQRNDFMQLLIDLKNNGDAMGKCDGKGLTIEELTAQAFVFFVAGFETSSTTMAFCLYELAANPDIQEKLRDEVRSVLKKHDGEITYDSIQDMKYMNQVLDGTFLYWRLLITNYYVVYISETLRKYPPLPILHRKCTANYKVENSDLIIEKDQQLVISVLGLHYDPEYFPDPQNFDPERFSEKNKGNINPHTYLPFGEGPRTCIGQYMFFILCVLHLIVSL